MRVDRPVHRLVDPIGRLPVDTARGRPSFTRAAPSGTFKELISSIRFLPAVSTLRQTTGPTVKPKQAEGLITRLQVEPNVSGLRRDPPAAGKPPGGYAGRTSLDLLDAGRSSKEVTHGGSESAAVGASAGHASEGRGATSVETTR